MASLSECDDDEIKNDSKGPSGKRSNIVRLNVGGHKFMSSRATLNQSGYFAGLLSGKFKVDLDDDGTYFVDRNGKWFGYLLDFMRSGITSVPRKSLPFILIESDYYQINLPLTCRDKLHLPNDKESVSSVVVRRGQCQGLPYVNGQYLGSNYECFGLERVHNQGSYRNVIRAPGGARIENADDFLTYLVTARNYEITKENYPSEGDIYLELRNNKSLSAKNDTNVMIISTKAAKVLSAQASNK